MKVVVVGAGMAGLTCALELVRAGLEVTVLEARARVGGRVWTRRWPDGRLAEVGATFLPDHHPLPLSCAQELGLELVALPAGGPAPPAGLGRFRKAVQAVVERQGDWPSRGGGWESFDGVSMAELLGQEGLTAGELADVELTLLGNFGDGLATLSALAAFRQLELQHGRGASFTVAGGNDRLPQAMADRLDVQLRTEVVAVRQSAHEVVLELRDHRSLRADRVVLALPAPAMVPGPWSEERRRVLAAQAWTPVTRIFLEVGSRFWEPGTAMLASQPSVRWLVGPPVDGPRGVIIAYVCGAAARSLAGQSEEDRLVWARREAARLFPDWTGAGGSSHSWDADPFARGGYPWPRPGDDSVPAALARPEGRVHFAGEHTTHHYGWIQGAMESGLRAAAEVLG